MAKATLPKPVLAYVGVTDLAVEIVRDLVTETQTRIAGVQKDVTARVADAQKTAGDPKALADRATTVVNARVDALAKDAKARREAIEARVAELQAEAKAYPGKVQKLVDDSVDTATDTYADLVKRGESLVGRVRRQESTRAPWPRRRPPRPRPRPPRRRPRRPSTRRPPPPRRPSPPARPRRRRACREEEPQGPLEDAASKTTASKTAATKTAAKKAPVRKAPAKKTTTAQSSAKATVTAAQKTAASATQAVTEAAEKVGD